MLLNNHDAKISMKYLKKNLILLPPENNFILLDPIFTNIFLDHQEEHMLTYVKLFLLVSVQCS